MDPKTSSDSAANLSSRKEWYEAVAILQLVPTAGFIALLFKFYSLPPLGSYSWLTGDGVSGILWELALRLVFALIPAVVLTFILTIAILLTYRKYQEAVLLGKYWYRGTKSTRYPSAIEDRSETLDWLIASPTAGGQEHHGDFDD